MVELSQIRVESDKVEEDLVEAVRSDGYKIIMTEDCGCPSEAFEGLYVVEDGKARCKLCGKAIKVFEVFVLNGCPKCTPAKLEELDKIERGEL